MYTFCPNCDKFWEFEYGAFEEGHRFGGSEPNTGYCKHCGFYYSEHVDYPMEKQVESFRKNRKGKANNRRNHDKTRNNKI